MAKRKLKPVKPKSFPALAVGVKPTEGEETADGWTINKFSLMEVSLVSVPANNDAALQHINKPIPPIMTQANIGDATGFCAPAGIIAIGYGPTDGGTDISWQTARSRLHFGRLRGFAEHIPHLLGASFYLDFCDRERSIYLAARMRYSEPGSGGHRSRVVWSGTGAFCISDDCEGWDAVYTFGVVPGSSVVLGRWRGSYRVWVGFYKLEELEAGGNEVTTSCGAAGFMGEPYRMFRDQVLTGDMPAPAFLDWLGEHYKYPLCMADFIRKCGFNPERN